MNVVVIDSDVEIFDDSDSDVEIIADSNNESSFVNDSAIEVDNNGCDVQSLGEDDSRSDNGGYDDNFFIDGNSVYDSDDDVFDDSHIDTKGSRESLNKGWFELQSKLEAFYQERNDFEKEKEDLEKKKNDLEKEKKDFENKQKVYYKMLDEKSLELLSILKDFETEKETFERQKKAFENKKAFYERTKETTVTSTINDKRHTDKAAELMREETQVFTKNIDPKMERFWSTGFF